MFQFSHWFYFLVFVYFLVARSRTCSRFQQLMQQENKKGTELFTVSYNMFLTGDRYRVCFYINFE